MDPKCTVPGYNLLWVGEEVQMLQLRTWRLGISRAWDGRQELQMPGRCLAERQPFGGQQAAFLVHAPP